MVVFWGERNQAMALVLGEGISKTQGMGVFGALRGVIWALWGQPKPPKSRRVLRICERAQRASVIVLE